MGWRAVSWGTLAWAVTACGGASPPVRDDRPPECRANAADVMAASLGGAAAGANGGRNQALDAFDARCRRAMEARRYNEQAQRDLDAQRLEMRRLELEEQRRRQQFALEDERMKLEVERLQGEARRSRAIAESLRGCQQKDPKECLAACRLGASSGCASLGFMFARGDGVALDKDAAVSAFQAACNLGDSVSCQRVGASPPATTASHKIMVFGGTKHDVYLGCFCDASASDSVFNESGKFDKQGINVTGGSLWGLELTLPDVGLVF